MTYLAQSQYNIRCEWGAAGIQHLAPGSDAIIIVDVLSFSTCVDIAVARGATIFPYRFRDESALDYAESLGASLASHDRNASGGIFSLSPQSLLQIPAGTRLVLPSPNGATLSLASGDIPTFAGCPRNASAVAIAARKFGPRVSVIPAGERWPDGTLRPSIEDWIGAGAIIHHLDGEKSPEAQLAESAFLHVRHDLHAFLRGCVSGRELIERGFGEDVELAAMLNTSGCAPMLAEGARYEVSHVL